MKSILTKTVLTLLVIALAVGVSFWLYTHKPKTKKAKPQRPVPIVKTMEVVVSREPIIFEASGTVIPARQVVLQSEVEGRVIEQNRELVPGGIIIKDELVIQIDPTDYRLQISEQQAEVATAQYELEVEQGKQIIARQEWQLLGKEFKENMVSQNLALRKPHLQNIKARLAAADSRLAAAKLAKKRTTIRAPFTGLVLEEGMEKGRFVGSRDAIATLVATDEFWAQVSVPLALLDRLRFPDNSGQQGSPALIILEKGYGGGVTTHEGSLFKLLPDLDTKGRMARLLVSIKDPFNLEVQEGNNSMEKDKQLNSRGKILLGSYVKVKLDAGMLDGIYVIPRKALREGDRLWFVNGEGIFTFRKVKVLWRRIDEVLVSMEPISDERLIISRLQSPVTGMLVRDQSRTPVIPERKKKGKI